MWMSRKLLVVAILAPVLSVSVHGAGATRARANAQAFQTVTPGVLTVATELGNPGWVNGLDPSNLTGGVEYKMALTFAKDFGIPKVEFRNVSFTPLVSGAVTGYDIGLMTIFKTAAREKVNTYSDCYYTDPTGAFVRKGVVLKTLADARRIRWGYVTGGYAGLIINKLNPSTTGKSFQDGPTEYLALQSGTIDAVMDDLSSIAGRSQSAGFKGSGDSVAAVFTIKGVTAPCSAVQLPKNSPVQNVQDINAGITLMNASGVFDSWVGQYLSPLVSKPYPTITVG